MGRELRRVPANWQHPKRDNGSYQPMFDEYYGYALDVWLADHNKWLDGSHADLISGPERKQEYPFYAMWGGNPPDVKYYQMVKYSDDELTHIQLYESTSEGTPLSPVFHKDDRKGICEWAENNATTFAHFKASASEWEQMLFGGIVHHTDGNVTFI